MRRAMQETPVQFLGWEDSLEHGIQGCLQRGQQLNQAWGTVARVSPHLLGSRGLK